MKKFCRYSLFLLCFAGYMPLYAMKGKLDYAFKKLDIDIPIRVLLLENTLKDTKWTLSSDEGFVVYAPESKKKTIFSSTGLTVTYKNGAFYANGQKQPDTHIFIMPLGGFISKGLINYDGVFSITKVKDTAYLVNHLDLEEYLQSVLRHEGMPGWPDEVQKAFCIAFRSYGISKILEQRALKEKNRWPYPYDIKNTNSHQIYGGHEKRACFKKDCRSNARRGISS